MSEIPAVFMLNKNNPCAESSGCVTVKREAVLAGHDEETIHEEIKIFATIDKDNGKIVYSRRRSGIIYIC